MLDISQDSGTFQNRTKKNDFLSFRKLCEPEKAAMPARGTELPHSLLCARQGVCVLEATELITDEQAPGIITSLVAYNDVRE